MRNRKLEKIDDYHYREESGDGKIVKWYKHIDPLSIELTNIQSGYRVEGVHREEIFDRFNQKWHAYRDNGQHKDKDTPLENISRERRTASEHVIEKEEKDRYFIKAEGVITNNKVFGIINEDNTFGKEYSGLEVDIGFYTHENATIGGNLLHVTGEDLRQRYRFDEYMSLILNVQNEHPENILKKMHEAENRKVTLNCHVEVFQSEIERASAKPWTRQTYYIPFDPSDCWAYFGSLEIVSRRK